MTNSMMSEERKNDIKKRPSHSVSFVNSKAEIAFVIPAGKIEPKKGVIKITEAIHSKENERYSRSFMRQIKIMRNKIAVKNIPPAAKK